MVEEERDRGFTLREPEALAALGDLLERARGNQQTPLERYGFSGRVDDFPERFLAWTWVARRIRERYDVSEPLGTALERACQAAVNDSEMAERFDAVASVFAAQERGDTDEVFKRLAELDSQLTAMQMVVLTTEAVLRAAAVQNGATEVALIEKMRGAFASGSRTGVPGGRDAVDLLTRDHRQVEAMFARLEDGPTEGALVSEILRALSVHDAIERQLLYPLVREKLSSEGDRLAEHCLDEHDEVGRLLSKIESGDDPTDKARLLTELIGAVRAHIAEEESAIFPELRSLIQPCDLTELASRMTEAEGRAPTHPHPFMPRSSSGAKVAGLVVGAIDKLRDAARR